MNITQTYTKSSNTGIKKKSIDFNLSQEMSHGDSVYLNAMVNHSLDYARLMLCLHKVVSSDLRTPERDKTKSYHDDKRINFQIVHQK